MAFATGEDVMKVVEHLVKKLWQNLVHVRLGVEPFQRLTYHEAMSLYGSDKPDLRIDSKV